MSQDGADSINKKQQEKISKKAKEMGYTNLAFFVEDLDVLLRPANLLKQKDMKYFELENLISLLINKEISLGMAPRMISMVSKYSERNEELEGENAELKQSNITMKSKYQTAELQVKEMEKQLKELSIGSQTDARIREESIKLIEENKYLKMTNESLTTDLKKTKDKLEIKLEEANDLEVENSQLELRMKDAQRELKETDLDLEALKRQGSGADETLETIEKLIEELDEAYATIDDPFKKEFVAFLGVELSEIVDNRHITKQKILNQIVIHAREIEKIFEPRFAAMKQVPYAPTPVVRQPKVQVEEKEKIPEPVIKKAPVEEVKEESAKPEVDEPVEDAGDSYVKPSEFLKGKSVHKTADKPKETKDEEPEEAKETEEDKEPKTKPKPVSYPKKSKKKKKGPVDRTPSPELIQVFDIFVKYLEAITDNSSFNDLCDKIIEELYEHVGSPGMTQVYKIKSGGVKRKNLLIDLLKKWKKELPEM